MAKEKQVDVTEDVTTNEEKQTKASKVGNKPQGKQVDKGEIVTLISQLPVKERMDLIRDLQNLANTDGDYYSTGREGTITHYDALRDGYHKKAEEDKEQETKDAE